MMPDDPIDDPTDAPDLAAEQLRTLLLGSFNDYHSSIALQTALVDRLIAAVIREERERATVAAPDRPRTLFS
jgi:hypothetical protein